MHPLNKLLALNKGRGYFRADTSNGESATLWLYDYITSDDAWGGVSAIAFAKELAGITAPTIHLRINSPGGDVFAARAMEQAVREHPSHIVSHVDGYAASAASYLALAADEVVIAPGGMFMIHNAWTIAMGNAADMQAMANLLGTIDATLIASYAAATGQAPEQLAEWMAAETWMTAQESVDRGFADSIAQPADKASARASAKALAAWDLSAYKNAPKTDLADAQEFEAELNTEPAPQPLTTTDFAALQRRLEVAARI